MISVVIPAYNAEKTLKTCLESLMCQTYRDIELIVVDDGSIDSTPSIVSEVMAKDSRVRLIKQPNAGVSAARNAGIDAAQGEFLAFVDADDTVCENYFESLAKLYIPDVLPVTDVVRSDKVGSALTPIERAILLDEGWIDRYFCGDIRYGVAFAVWNKLFSAEKLHSSHIRFDTTLTIGEDMLFVFDYLCHCKKICFTDAVHYNYTIADGSTMSANKDYAPMYENTFKKLQSDSRISSITQEKWAFEATVDIIARPFVLNKSRREFIDWWRRFRKTDVCRAALNSNTPSNFKYRLLYVAMHSKQPTSLWLLVWLKKLKQ